MLPPDVMEKLSPHKNSKKKNKQKSEETNENDNKIVTKNPATPCVNSNWKKFQSVCGQQDSTEKQPKRQHTHSTKSSNSHRKTPRMIVPVRLSEVKMFFIHFNSFQKIFARLEKIFNL